MQIVRDVAVQFAAIGLAEASRCNAQPTRNLMTGTVMTNNCIEGDRLVKRLDTYGDCCSLPC